MKNFTCYKPTEIVFGKGAEARAAELVKKHGGTRVMLVYGGGSAVKSGLIGGLEMSLASAGIAFMPFGGVQANPTLDYAREGVEKAIAFGADMILAAGGGSAIDTAKAIALGAANPGTDVWSIWTGTKPDKCLPVGVVLTISAAGSETSNSAVLTNVATGEKRGFGSDFLRPKFALMNPELTFTLPPYQIACGIVDIMMHTMDRYFAVADDVGLTTELGEAVLRVTIENGRKAMQNPSDYDAMAQLMWCGSVSHDGLTGFGFDSDFAVHQLGHEISGMFGAAHGASLSMMWASWARYVVDAGPERFARYAEKVWGVRPSGDAQKDALAGIAKTEEYFKSLNMPTCFSEAEPGVQSDAVIAELALRCSFHEKRLVGRTRKLGRADLQNIYTLANR